MFHRSHVTLATLLYCVMVLGGCTSQPTVYSNADSGTDFSQFKTYAFFDHLATDKSNYESLESNFLKVAVAQQMDRRGFAFDHENPDLLLNFYIHTKEKVRSQSVPTMSGYYGWRDPFYDPWGGYGVAYETRIIQFTEGTLNIDVVNARTKKLVWEGATVGRITDTMLKDLENTVDQAVQDVFTAFPLPASDQPGSS